MEKLTQEKIAELKKTHGRILRAELSYTDERRTAQNIAFYYRPPRMEEIERLQATAQKSNAVANLALLADIIVHPHAGEITDKLKNLPAVIGQFVQSEVLPFLGEYTNAKVQEL